MSGLPHRDGVALLRALGERRDLPLGVHLQVADRCNHTCVHCYQIQGLKGELTLDQLRAILDDLAAAGVLTLNVSGGEATLRHDLMDILAHARARGFAVRLYTNAFLVDDALADRLAGVGLHEVHVSVYSGVAAEHDAVTRVPGSFARTLAGVRALRARGVRVVLKCPATALAPRGPVGVGRLADDLGCAFVPSSELTAMEDGSLDSRRVAAASEDLLAMGMLSPWAPEEGDEDRRASRLGGGSCGVGRSGLVVLPNGDVLPCTDTPVTLGNLSQRPLAAVVREAPAMDLFRRLSWRDVHGCRDCDLLLACTRCHATALHEGGDYLGPYPSACARARVRYAAGISPGIGPGSGPESREVELLAPAEGCEVGRRRDLGPYRIEGAGQLRPIPDVITPEDAARAARHPWVRGGEYSGGDGGAGDLVPATRLLERRVEHRGERPRP